MKHPDRYVITALVKEGEYKGKRVWMYFSEEGGGWWMWSNHEPWAYRFQSKSGGRIKDAIWCARNNSGPWYYYVDPETVEIRPTPAIVKVY